MADSKFWLPTSPFTAVDALNRAAIATGGAGQAAVARDADFNGHRYEAAPALRNRGTYNVFFQWAGHNMLAREVDLLSALRLVCQRAQVGRGGSGIVTLADDADIDINTAACRAAGLVPYAGPETAFQHGIDALPWQCGGVWKGFTSVGYAFAAIRLAREQGIPTSLFLEAESYAAWQDAIASYRVIAV